MATETATIKDWKEIPFSDCLQKVKIGREKQVKEREYLKTGLFPIVDQGQSFVAGYTDEKSKVIFDIQPFIIFGDHTRILKYIDFPIALGADGTKVIKPTNDFDTKFFFYFLKYLNIPSRGYNRHFTLLKEKNISQPELREQKSIARVLTTVQEAITGQEELIAKLKELKRGMMQYLFTHGTKGEKTKMTEIGEVPESWEISEFQDMVEFSKKPKGMSLNTDIHFVPMDMVPADGMFIKKFEIKKKVTSGTFVINGDILLSKITPSFENGKQGILEIDSEYGYATTEVIPFHEKINTEKLFIFYWLKKDDVRNDLSSKMEGSTGRRRLSRSVLDKKLMPKPGIAEQKEIANILVSVDQKIEIAEEKLSAYQNLFKTLLHELMSGERRIKIL